jgi:hypothetical protein
LFKCLKQSTDYIQNLIKETSLYLGCYTLNKYINFRFDDHLVECDFKILYPKCELFLLGNECSVIYPAILEWSGSTFTVYNCINGLGYLPDTPYTLYGPISVDSSINTNITLTFNTTELTFDNQISPFLCDSIVEFSTKISSKSCTYNRVYYKTLKHPDYIKIIDDYCVDQKDICLKLNYNN